VYTIATLSSNTANTFNLQPNLIYNYWYMYFESLSILL